MKKILLISVVFLYLGCSHTIRYALNEVPAEKTPWGRDSLVICITELEDLRKEESRFRKNLFGDKRPGSICYNAEYKYGSKPTPEQIRRIWADHFESQYSNVFITYDKLHADYYVSMKLVEFYARAEINESAQAAALAGSQFGLIGGVAGALAVAKMNSFVDYKICYGDVKIYRNDNRCIAHLGNIINEGRKKTSAITNCNSVYGHLDNVLLEFHTKLNKDIVNAIAYAQYGIGESKDAQNAATEKQSSPSRTPAAKAYYAKIFLKNGQTGEGYIDAVTDKYVIYRKSRYGNQIQLLRQYVKEIQRKEIDEVK